MITRDYYKLVNSDFYRNQFLEISERYKGKSIVLYGVGEVFEALCKIYNLNNYFDIKGVSDRKFQNEEINNYNGFKVIKPSELKDYKADSVLLTLAYPAVAQKALLKDEYKFINEIRPFFDEIDPILSYDVKLVKKDGEKTYYHLNDYDVNVVSDSYSEIIEEIFFKQIYDIKNKFNFSDYNFFDIGMNRAYTDIYFALDKRCKMCFGFEPFKETYNYAIENVSINPNLKNKIQTFNLGLSDQNSLNDVYFLPHRDGISTVSYDFIKNYAPEEISNLKKETVELKKADEIISEILNNNPATHNILKIDAEGAEYQVIPILFNSGILKEFNIIVGDMHIINSKEETKKLFEYFYIANFEKYELNEREKTMDYIFYKNIDIV